MNINFREKIFVLIYNIRKYKRNLRNKNIIEYFAMWTNNEMQCTYHLT